MTDQAVFYNYKLIRVRFTNYEKTPPLSTFTILSKSKAGFGRKKT